MERRPGELITYYDGATGERVGLTAPELGRWSAATAALLTGECGLRPGSRAGVLLPPHWQTAVVLLGAWAAGLEVSFRGWSTAGLSDTGLSDTGLSDTGLSDTGLSDTGLSDTGLSDTGLSDTGRADDEQPEGRSIDDGLTGGGSADGRQPEDRPAGGGPVLEVTFVEARRVGSWLDDVPRARHQFVLGAAAHGVPDDYRDFLPAARAHLGAGAPVERVADEAAAVPDGTTFGEYGAVAAAVAQSRGIARGDRVLIETDASEEPLIWLLAPLTAGASIVLGANLDRSQREELMIVEGVTRLF
ncbi:TIGR03089 family protein [Actinoplanes sp. NPDC020271]|uniref:TIGR03089 family protein n=1 Tax=Actinoplanes sp. NPDC020271 TaxID=3363896 RepID=UPI00378CAE9E